MIETYRVPTVPKYVKFIFENHNYHKSNFPFYVLY